jgi:hypothetical protein
MTGNPRPMSGFDDPVRRWQDIPGWFQWRSAQREAVADFGDGCRFVEVGCYLGRSICSLAEEVGLSGHAIAILGVDTARGSGPEGRHNTNAHGPAVEHGGGTFAGLLHRNVIARHDYPSVRADIAAWAPKVQHGGWLSGDDYDEYQWPGVIRAVSDTLPGAQRWGRLNGDGSNLDRVGGASKMLPSMASVDPGFGYTGPSVMPAF